MMRTYVCWSVAGYLALLCAASAAAQELPQKSAAVRVLGAPHFGTGASFRDLVLSRDDRQLITVADVNEREIVIWDRQTRKPIRHLAHRWALQIALSADGTRLASCGVEGDVRFWDLKSGAQLWRGAGQSTNTPFAVACSADGKMVAVGKGEVEILDAATGKELRRIQRSFNNVAAVAFSPDSSLLAAVDSGEFKIRLWDPRTGKVVRTLDDSLSPYALTFTSDGKKLIGVGSNKAAFVWDVATGKVLQKLVGPSDYNSALALSKDGKLLAVGGGTREANHRRDIHRAICIWDLDAGKLLHTLPALPHNLHGLCFTSDARTLISACASLRFWDVKTGRQIDPPACHEDHVTALAFGADGKSLVSAGLDRTVRTWDLPTQEQRAVHLLPDNVRVQSIRLAPRGDVTAATLADDAGVAIFDSAAGKERRRFAQANHEPRFFSALGSQLILSQPKGLVRWDYATGKADKSWVTPEAFAYSPVDPAERLVHGFRSTFRFRNMTSSYDMILWDLHNNQIYHRFETDSPYATPNTAFTPDGKTLIAGYSEGLLWEIASAKPRGKLRDGKGLFGNYFVAPNGRWFAVIASHHVEIWDLLTGKRLYQWEGDASFLSSPTWSADSRSLAAARGVQIVVWDVAKLVGAPAALQPITAERFEKCWTALAADDAEVAYRAVCELRLAEPTFIPWLTDRLTKMPAPDLAVVDRLLRDLDHPKFPVRNKAMRELERMDPSIAAHVKKALAQSPHLESKRRLEMLYAKLTGPIEQPEFLRVVRSLEVLENHADPAARKALAELIMAQPDRFWTHDLRRALARFEKP